MAVTNGYCTRDELKTWMRKTSSVVPDDSKLDRCITATSRAIDHHCGRHFFQTTSVRYFDTDDTVDLTVGDIINLTELATDDTADGTYPTVWVAADYQLLPLESVDPVSGEPRPRDTIHAVGTRSFPTTRSRLGRVGLIRVTGAWGWPKVPEGVRQACLLKANRLSKRAESPEGLAGGFEEFGVARISPKDDPDAVRLLKDYRLGTVMVGIA